MSFLSTSSAETSKETTDEPPPISYLPSDNHDVKNGPYSTAVQIMQVVEERAEAEGRSLEEVALTILGCHNYHRQVAYYVMNFAGIEQPQETERSKTVPQTRRQELNDPDLALIS